MMLLSHCARSRITLVEFILYFVAFQNDEVDRGLNSLITQLLRSRTLYSLYIFPLTTVQIQSEAEHIPVSLYVSRVIPVVPSQSGGKPGCASYRLGDFLQISFHNISPFWVLTQYFCYFAAIIYICVWSTHSIINRIIVFSDSHLHMLVPLLPDWF